MRAPTLALLTGLVSLCAASARAQTAWSVQSNGNDHLYRIDLASGVATDIGATGFSDIESLSFSPSSGLLYGVDDVTDQLVTIDTASGAATAVGPLGVNITDTGLSFDCLGRLWMSTDAPKNPTNLYRLDPATGLATLVGNQGQEVTGLAARGTVLYGLGGDLKNNLVKIDTTTGAASVVGPLLNVSLSDGGIDFDAGGTLWGIDPLSNAAGNPSQIFTISTATGVASVQFEVADPAGNPLGGFEGLAIEGGLVCVPALPAWALVALAWGLAAAGALALRAGAFRGRGRGRSPDRP